MFCNHQWNVLSESVTQSKFEHAMTMIRSGGAIGNFTVPSQMSCAERKHIAVFVCDKCGKLKRFVEAI
jgi:hypothetical protein